MKKWKIPVSYIITGTIVVEAKSLDDAINKVWDNHSLKDIVDEEYLADSFQIDDVDDLSLIRDWYNDGQCDEL